MKAASIALAIAAASPCLAQGPNDRHRCQASDAARAVCAVEARVTDALRLNDADLLAQIYADDFQLTNYRGVRVGKAGVLDALRVGALRFDSLTTSDLEVRIYGVAAVVTGRQHQIVREPGGDGRAHPKDVRFMHVYIQAAGRWRLTSSQITPILAPASPR